MCQKYLFFEDGISRSWHLQTETGTTSKRITSLEIFFMLHNFMEKLCSLPVQRTYETEIKHYTEAKLSVPFRFHQKA